ncbi:hypothetical protein B0H67DRAFT_569946 [Lasiosphaeris hirsuta]|uniref:Uncharacterized protein n=1 Tax=Lasiosphaeris hirsuta TaxID=260670 RepID=A0AA40B0A5_9PEZI|nr:hypothetical protein B0H67DRAFT_569946 [Lasiosphaeris hirsuta]
MYIRPALLASGLFSDPACRREGVAIPILDSPLNWHPTHRLAQTHLGLHRSLVPAVGELTRAFGDLPLCVNAVTFTGTNFTSPAASMGKALAILHWGTGVNGEGLEFGLGTLVSHVDEGLQHWGL